MLINFIILGENFFMPRIILIFFVTVIFISCDKSKGNFDEFGVFRKNVASVNEDIDFLDTRLSKFNEGKDVFSNSLKGLNLNSEDFISDVIALEKKSMTLSNEFSELKKKTLDLQFRVDTIKNVSSSELLSFQKQLSELNSDIESIKDSEISMERLGLVKVANFVHKDLSDSEIIEKAIEKAKTYKNRILLFDTKNWNLDRAIQVPSNTIVILNGTILKQNNFVFDNIFRGDNLVLDKENLNGLPIDIREIKEIKILGINGAQIIGSDKNATFFNPYFQEVQEALGDYYGWRTLQISFTRCTGLEIAGIKFSQPKCWCISLDWCQNIKIHDLQIYSNVKNGDGVDIRKGCNNFEIYNIEGDTSDDLIAITALTNELDFTNRPNMFPIEPSTKIVNELSGLEGGIHHGVIRNIKKVGRYHAVIVLSSGGRKNQFIEISNVEEIKARTRNSLVEVYTGYGYGYNEGDISNIKINNVHGIGRYNKAVVYCNTRIFNSEISKVTSVYGKNILLDFPEGIKVVNN